MAATWLGTADENVIEAVVSERHPPTRGFLQDDYMRDPVHVVLSS